MAVPQEEKREEHNRHRVVLRAGRVCTAQSHFYRESELPAFEKNQNLLLTYMDQVTQR